MSLPTVKGETIGKTCLVKPTCTLHLIATKVHADQEPESCIAFSLIHRDPGIYLDLMSLVC